MQPLAQQMIACPPSANQILKAGNTRIIFFHTILYATHDAVMKQFLSIHLSSRNTETAPQGFWWCPGKLASVLHSLSAEDHALLFPDRALGAS